MSNEEPGWDDVNQCIQHAFQRGGKVTLTAATREDIDKLNLGSVLAMDSHPGEYRLVYDPLTLPNEKTKRREWWESGDEPFRGTANFHDHEWDDRTVCREIKVALHIFRDFFDHSDLTESSTAQTRSVWDRKSR